MDMTVNSGGPSSELGNELLHYAVDKIKRRHGGEGLCVVITDAGTKEDPETAIGVVYVENGQPNFNLNALEVAKGYLELFAEVGTETN